jgi:hypothetical protein
VSPILESIGSVKGFGWGAFLGGGSFESIATVTVGSGGAANVEFTSIPQTYKHLQIRALARSTTPTGSSASNEMWIRFNSDTASNYASHELNSFGTGRQSYAKTSTAGPRLSLALPRDATTANVYGSSIITILDYTNTNIYKTVRTLYGWNAGGSHTGMSSVHWRSTSAITSITFLGEQDNFKQHTTFALYGIKG